MKLRSLALSIVFLASACVAKANTGIETNGENSKTDIAGGVVHADTKKPLHNVQVIAYMANKKEKSVLTDHNGQFTFDDLKPGTYKLVFEKDGYKKTTKDKVQIRGDEGYQFNIEMSEVESFLLMPGLLLTDLD
jgi:5-hydroxyisourate hydrolase-like protein (transthyretin family)